MPWLGRWRNRAGPGKSRPEAPRANRARAVSDMLPDIGRAAFRRFGFVQSSIVSRWREIVGDRYAAVSSPESIRFPAGKSSDGVLNLVVEGAHAPMMQHVAPRSSSGSTASSAIRRWPGSPSGKAWFRSRGETAPRPPSLRPIPAELGDSLREVADPELRACLESLARGVAANEAALGPAVAIPVLGRIGGDTKR
jgi:hypothetical protein